jgi:predicted dehydrogenase
MTLRAVVIGTGFAGEGHVIALRDAGVEVVALCGRTPSAAQARARQLGVDDLRLDWRRALDELRPDIVTIATPGHTHRPMAEYAAALGCHVVCEKPLAPTAGDARAALAAVERAGVRHAYAATARYSPAAMHAASLVARGLIGTVGEVESIVRFDFPVMPFGWVHDLERGGGMLHNVLTHRLAQVLLLTGGQVVGALGTCSQWNREIPVGPELHDFRHGFAPLTDEYLTQVREWKLPDADGAYNVTIDIQMPQGHIVRSQFHGSCFGASPSANYLALYGDTGTLVLEDGHEAEHVRHYDSARDSWEDIPLPNALRASLPRTEDPVQRSWNLFFRAFVAAVQGAGPVDFPTFSDGWIAAEIADAVRAERALQGLQQPAALSQFG